MAEQLASESSDTMELDSDPGDVSAPFFQSDDEETNRTYSTTEDEDGNVSSQGRDSHALLWEESSSYSMEEDRRTTDTEGDEGSRTPSMETEEGSRTPSREGQEGSRAPSIEGQGGSTTPSIEGQEGSTTSMEGDVGGASNQGEHSSRSPSSQEEGRRNPSLLERRSRSPITRERPESANDESPQIRRRRRMRTRQTRRRQVLESDEDSVNPAPAVREALQAQEESQEQAGGSTPSPSPSVEEITNDPQQQAREQSASPSPSVEEVSNSPRQQQQEEEPTREEGASSTSRPDSVETVDGPAAEAGPSTSAAAPVAASENQSKGESAGQVNSDSEDEGLMCSICFEPVSNMGNHHLACLKCGHMFGYECINKWLAGSGQKGRCPQCNSLSSKKDVRKLYAKNVKVVDTTEKERLKKDLEKEREERRKIEVELETAKLQCKLKTQKLSEVKKELEALKASVNSKGLGVTGGEVSTSRSRARHRLVFNQFLELSRKEECRVMAYNEWLAMLVVSTESQVEMFPGYGIKKINMLELRVECFVPLHQQLIRDLAFNPSRRDMLLSVAVDRQVKIINIQSNGVMGLFVAPAPVWCCCWSIRDTNIFYVGTAAGNLIQYDIRHTDGPTGVTELPGKGPVVSLSYINPGPESTLTSQGLLVARLQQCAFVEEWLAKTHTLSAEGNLLSVSCVPDSCHVLVSFRPSPQFPHTRHAVCTLDQREGDSGQEVFFNPLHTFRGGTKQGKLNRSLLIRPPFNKSSLLVCAGDEASQSLFVWDVATLTCFQQLQCSAIVMDTLQLSVGQKHYLAVLTPKGVRLYDWPRAGSE